VTLFTILAWSLPAVIALATVEGLILTFVAKRAYDWRSWAASATDALVREYVVYAFVSASLAGPLIEMAWQHRLTTVPLNGFASFAVLFLGQEFCYYWFHRAAHRVRWFWATHAVHHSPNEFNLGIAYRFGWTGRLAGNAVFFVPMIWLGFPPKAVFAALALNLLYSSGCIPNGCRSWAGWNTSSTRPRTIASITPRTPTTSTRTTAAC
jgi:sterol desaturase/sphingolipid hydroxylase (fatty acid hydroxylase superfamily)